MSSAKSSWMTAAPAASAFECRVSLLLGRVSNRVAGEGHCFALPGKIGEGWDSRALHRHYLREKEGSMRGLYARYLKLDSKSSRVKYWRGAIYWNTCYFYERQNCLRSRGEFQSAMSFRAAARAIYVSDLSPINKSAVLICK